MLFRSHESYRAWATVILYLAKVNEVIVGIYIIFIGDYTMDKPEGCYSASQIPTFLRIGYEWFYNSGRAPLPPADGLYASRNHNKRLLPYWKGETLINWLAAARGNKCKEKQS